MDCDLARLMLPFSRPGELLAGDAAMLVDHLNGCAACRARAELAARSHETWGRAFRDVPVPAAGRQAVLSGVARLEARRRRAWRIQSACAALALVVTLGLAAGTAGRLRPEPDAYQIASEAGFAWENPELVVRDYLASEELSPPPSDLNYAHYLNHGTLPIAGSDAPAVAFTFTRPNGRRETATFYALESSRFRLKGLDAFAQASFYNVTVLDAPADPGVKWVVVHTTPDLTPFGRGVIPPDA